VSDQFELLWSFSLQRWPSPRALFMLKIGRMMSPSTVRRSKENAGHPRGWQLVLGADERIHP